MARKTTRLYYGLSKTGKPLYWTLKVKNATRPVKFKSTVEEAMKGRAGSTIGCHLSLAAMKDKDTFDFPVEYVAFTRTGALAVTKVVNGSPSHCVRYRHNYSKYVDLNDKDPTKKVVKEHPELFNRNFILHPYKTQENHWKAEYGRKETHVRKKGQIKMVQSALRRMKDAGMFVTADV